MPIKTEMRKTSGSISTTKSVPLGPDVNMGGAIVRNVGMSMAGMFPKRPDDDEMGRIAIVLIDEQSGEGMYFLMTEAEARDHGNAMLRLADKETRDRYEAEFEAQEATKQ